MDVIESYVVEFWEWLSEKTTVKFALFVSKSIKGFLNLNLKYQTNTCLFCLGVLSKKNVLKSTMSANKNSTLEVVCKICDMDQVEIEDMREHLKSKV